VANKIRVIVDSESDSASCQDPQRIEPPRAMREPLRGGVRRCHDAYSSTAAGRRTPRVVLDYSWSTTCDGTFDDPRQPSRSHVGGAVAAVQLHRVSHRDGRSGLSDSDSATVSISDTLRPRRGRAGQPDSAVQRRPARRRYATDVCDASVVPATPRPRRRSCAGNYTLTAPGPRRRLRQQQQRLADDRGAGHSRPRSRATRRPRSSRRKRRSRSPPPRPTTAAAPRCRSRATTAWGRTPQPAVVLRGGDQGGKMTILDSGGERQDQLDGEVGGRCGNATSTLCVVDVVNPGRSRSSSDRSLRLSRRAAEARSPIVLGEGSRSPPGTPIAARATSRPATSGTYTVFTFTNSRIRTPPAPGRSRLPDPAEGQRDRTSRRR